MKRLILPLFALFFLFAAGAPAAIQAGAQEYPYAVAPSDTVWFYAAENEESRLFLLPLSYYVRVLSYGEKYSRVEYLDNSPPFRKLSGYCRTDSITKVDFIPERPYLYREITLTYTLPDTPAFGSGNFSSITRTFYYYGMREEGGALYFYVHDENGVCDFIPAREPLEYDLNTDYLKTDEPAASLDAEASVAGPSAVQIVIICLACVAAVAVAVLVVRGKRTSPAPSAKSVPAPFGDAEEGDF